MFSDRDLINWDQRLKDQADRGWDNYKVKRIDLTAARIDEPLLVVGEFIYVEQSSSAAAVATIKLNRDKNHSLDLEKGVEIKSVFKIVFISNDALAGEWIDLVFGINFEYYKVEEKGEAQPCNIITNVAADSNTIGADKECYRVLVRAFTTNNGLVWINFRAAAIENQCYPLAAGDAVSVPLNNTNLINALFKVANEDVAVVYEV